MPIRLLTIPSCQSGSPQASRSVTPPRPQPELGRSVGRSEGVVCRGCVSGLGLIVEVRVMREVTFRYHAHTVFVSLSFTPKRGDV